MSNASTRRAAAAAEAAQDLRVSAYDQVASLLISALILVGFFVGMLLIIWLTTRLLFTRVPVAVELVDYAGRGDHAEGFERDLEEPGLEEMEELTEPSLDATLEAVTDVISTQAAAFDTIATNAEATSKGKGGLGDSRRAGPAGDGDPDVIPPWERWEIRYTTSGIDAYAAQLDAFKIELGAIGGGSSKVDYAYNLRKASPDKRPGDPDKEDRLYMTYQDTNNPLAVFDRQLLGRAGINVNRRLILQFYPDETKKQLQLKEAQNANGHNAREFLKTIFGVRAGAGGKPEFYVIQQFFRPDPRG